MAQIAHRRHRGIVTQGVRQDEDHFLAQGYPLWPRTSTASLENVTSAESPTLGSSRNGLLNVSILNVTLPMAILMRTIEPRKVIVLISPVTTLGFLPSAAKLMRSGRIEMSILALLAISPFSFCDVSI